MPEGVLVCPSCGEYEYEPGQSPAEFLLERSYEQAGRDFWHDPGGHYVYEDYALEIEGYPG
jgi:hypothetical protein